MKLLKEKKKKKKKFYGKKKKILISMNIQDFFPSVVSSSYRKSFASSNYKTSSYFFYE